jgi:glc operon protein GlcG
MFKITALVVIAMTVTSAAKLTSVAWGADLPVKKTLNLAAIKTMVAAAEAEALKRNVQVTICIVDESGNLLYLQKADGAGLNTIQFAQKKARHSAFYKQPSKAAADKLKAGDLEVLAFPDAFPNQGGLPIQVDGQTIGGIGVSGAPSEVDEAIGRWSALYSS